MVKKLIPILLAFAAMFCTLPMRGDSPPDRSHEIPVKKLDKNNKIRSLCDIQACYYGMLSAIHTTVATDLGEIEVIVTNCSTGEVWYDTFDSSLHTQHVLSISGTPGHYEVIYSVESGDLYEGTFVIE